MAVTPVKLEVDGYKEREVMSVSFVFNKALDDEGQVVGIARGGKFKIRVKALNDGTPELMDWMIQRNLAKNAKITFNETKSGKQMKQYEITGGYCVGYAEHYADKEAHYEDIEITCQHIKFSKAEFDNPWK